MPSRLIRSWRAFLLPLLVLASASLSADEAFAVKGPIQPLSAVASGSVDLLLIAGGGLYGPTLGLKARFRNGFELGFRHSQWADGQAQDAGLYFMPASSLESRRRPYFGTEFFRSDRVAHAFDGVEALTAKADRPAILLVAGQEHRMGSRMALAYEAAGGARLTRQYTGPLPPLAFQLRAQMLCRLF